jgi:hypothetical protein
MSSRRGQTLRVTASALFALLVAATAVSRAQSAAPAHAAQADAATNGKLALSAKEKGLVIPQEADRVSYHANPSGSIQVSYVVHEPFPAKQIIKEIDSHLASAGWKPVSEARFIPRSTVSRLRHWSQYVDDAGGTLKDYWRWTAAWQNANGDLIEYAMSYSRPFRSKVRMSDASISGNWMSAAKAESDRDSIKRAREHTAKGGER